MLNIKLRVLYSRGTQLQTGWTEKNRGLVSSAELRFRKIFLCPDVSPKETKHTTVQPYSRSFLNVMFAPLLGVLVV